MTPKIGELIARIEHGERVVYRVVDVNVDTRTVRMEPVSVAGYLAIGLPARITVAARKGGAE